MMADIAAETGWTFDQIRTHSLDELAALRRAVNKRNERRDKQGGA